MMKNIFRNTASLDTLRGQLTKKNVTSLLILPAIVAVLFITPTIAFASNNVRDAGPDGAGAAASSAIPPSPTTKPKTVGRGPDGAGGAIPPPSDRSSNPTALTLIRMLDKTHGWALTQSAILNTVDGGLHWQNVTPANAKFNPRLMSKGHFLNAQNAWVVTPQGSQKSVSLLRTTDGGKSWQSSTIQTTETVSSAMLHFLNTSNGWLQALGEPGPVGESGLGGRPLFIFQTTDGGQHWKQFASPNPKDIPDPSGISFSDMQTGWEAGDNPTAAMSGTINNAQPLLVVTHDGGKTWKSQPLPVLPGVGKSDMVSTYPPVFFGKNGLLPVVDQIVPPRGSKSKPGIGLNLYVTQNGGQTWTPTKLVTSNGLGLSSFTFYIADMQHAWAASGTNLYATSNNGQSWTKLPPTPQPISELSFVDANNGWAIASTNVTPDNTKNQPPSLLRTTNGGRTWQPIKYSIVGKSTATSPIGKGSTSPTPVGSPGKACGFLLYQLAAGGKTGLTLMGDADDQQHVACFLQAFQQCVPASISFVVHSSGPPTTTNNDFSTKPQSGSCAISKSVSLNMEPQPKEAETCARVEQTGTDLRFVNCEKTGTITFPLVPKTPPA